MDGGCQGEAGSPGPGTALRCGDADRPAHQHAHVQRRQPWLRQIAACGKVIWLLGLHPKAADFCRAARACRSRLALNLPQLLPVAHWNVLRMTAVRTEWEVRRARCGV